MANMGYSTQDQLGSIQRDIRELRKMVGECNERTANIEGRLNGIRWVDRVCFFATGSALTLVVALLTLWR